VNEDIIGLVVYVDDIWDRNNFRRRPNRHVVLMNESCVCCLGFAFLTLLYIKSSCIGTRRGRLLIVHIQDPHLVRHIWQWRPAASGFRTMAAFHVRKNAVTCTPITSVHSNLIST
jgi:hypothetical protein